MYPGKSSSLKKREKTIYEYKKARGTVVNESKHIVGVRPPCYGVKKIVKPEINAAFTRVINNMC